MKQILARFFILASFFTASLLKPSLSLAETERLPQGDFSALKDISVRIVTDIIDPLTVKLDDGATVHLTGLDYPDWDHYDPGPISLTAVKVLTDFLLNQKVIVYQTKKKGTGRFNRMGQQLAHLVRKKDGSWVQGTLLTLGVARVRTTKSNPEMAGQMYVIERMARKENAGLWKVDAYQPLSPEEAERVIGSFALVEGTIIKAAMKSNRLYLNFGQNWRNDFTVSISGKDRRDFQKAGIDPMQWNGEKVRVRGWVSSYNGPYIEIDHPERVELLFNAKGSVEDQDHAITDEKTKASDMIRKQVDKPQKQEADKSSALPVFNDG